MRTHGEQKTVFRNDVGKVMKHVSSRAVGVAMCISRTISKKGLRDISKLHHFSRNILRNSMATAGLKF